jgi:hypothetical protein
MKGPVYTSFHLSLVAEYLANHYGLPLAKFRRLCYYNRPVRKRRYTKTGYVNPRSSHR